MDSYTLYFFITMSVVFLVGLAIAIFTEPEPKEKESR